MGFADSIKNSTKKIKEEVNTSINRIADDLFTEVVKRTPVADGSWGAAGTLINNWYVGFGAGNYNTSFSDTPNRMGISSYSQILKLVSSREFVSKDGEISYTNSTPYAYRAEIIGWPQPEWSGRVGPYAMVRNSLTVIAPKYRG